MVLEAQNIVTKLYMLLGDKRQEVDRRCIYCNIQSRTSRIWLTN